MDIREDRWLSEILGHQVFKIAIDTQGSNEQNERPADLVRDHAQQCATAMYYAKIPTHEIEVVRQLALAGLYVVDVNVTFGLDANSQTAAVGGERCSCSIGQITPDQNDRVLAIAGSCFRYSRFHLDPLMPVEIAHKIKGEWIFNYIRKQRGERLFVASINGQPAGFLAVIGSQANGRSIRTIDLVGVDKSFQGHGVGYALGRFFIDYYRDRCDLLQVGTQVANVPSIRLYDKLGFSLVKSDYVMHMHIRDGMPQA